MLNCYPLWKYIMLVLMLIIGIIYAIPNFYGEDPAIQITGIRGIDASRSSLVQIHNILNHQHIPSKSITLEKGTILIRFSNQNIQMHAHEVLLNSLGKNYIIALNLVPATPVWLACIGAEPLKLGLDLRGGVHFLMEVDTETILGRLREQTIETMRCNLRDKHIPYATVRKIKNYGSEIRFRDAMIRDQAMVSLSSCYRNLVISRIGNNSLSVTFTDDYLHEANESAVQQNIIILRNRVNQLGITEPLVQRQGFKRIVVELPGIQDTAHAKEILGATATLEFRLVNSNLDPAIFTNSSIPEDSEIKFMRNGQPVVLYKHVILTGDHIVDSTLSTDEYNRQQVNISLGSYGGSIMYLFTKDNIGKLMATLFVEYKDSGQKDTNGRVILIKHEEIINIAAIQSQLGKSFRITGINNQNEARQLSLLLRAGTLTAPIQIIEERTIGPILGAQNITQGIEACFWALITSIIFMISWYHKFGIIAVIILIVNLIMIVSIMSLLPGATLTMPGIAGIILILAVTVDANVLINERIKDELRNGRTVQQAIHKGYRGAFPSIIDANITTMIITIILYIIGTGSIKGFAITTIIGITISMFTSIIGTRAIINLIYGSKYIDKLSI